MAAFEIFFIQKVLVEIRLTNLSGGVRPPLLPLSSAIPESYQNIKKNYIELFGLLDLT